MRLVLSKTRKKVIGVAVVAAGLASLGVVGTMSAHAAETHGPYTELALTRGDKTRDDALTIAAATCITKFGDTATSQPVKIEYVSEGALITFYCIA
jgi:hypothetical protein